jgi:hypothetical protein
MACATARSSLRVCLSPVCTPSHHALSVPRPLSCRRCCSEPLWCGSRVRLIRRTCHPFRGPCSERHVWWWLRCEASSLAFRRRTTRSLALRSINLAVRGRRGGTCTRPRPRHRFWRNVTLSASAGRRRLRRWRRRLRRWCLRLRRWCRRLRRWCRRLRRWCRRLRRWRCQLRCDTLRRCRSPRQRHRQHY